MPLSLSLGLGLSARNTGGGFSLAAFMAAQADGFWYDFGQTDRLFQEDVGPTPADTANEVIGLALDQRTWGGQTLAQIVAAAPELEVDANWTLGTNASRVGGTITQPTNTGSFSSQLVNTVATRLYRLRFTINVGSFFCSVWDSAPTSGIIIPAAGYGVGTYDRYFTAVDGDATFSFTGLSAGSNQISGISIKEVCRKPATQATGSLKPKFQTTGAAFDGSDDNLLTGYVAGAGANFMVAKVTVPASIPGTQIIAGAFQTAINGHFTLGVSSGGQVRAACGTGLISAGPDLRGRQVVIGISTNGSTERIFADGALISERSNAFTPPSGPIRLGALNSDGIASSFFAGSIDNTPTGRQFLDLATFNQIASQL